LVECPEAFGVEAGDVVLATKGVVLEDLIEVSVGSYCETKKIYLICGTFSSTTNDSQLSVETLGCKGIFADILPPNCKSQ
jgi:hypothetical protein